MDHCMNAFVVEHDCQMYLELMVRSLLDKNPWLSDKMSLTVIRNGKPPADLEAADYYRQKEICIMNSGYPLNVGYVTHGKALTSPILSSLPSEFILLLDPDLVFVDQNDIKRAVEYLSSSERDAVTFQSMQTRNGKRLHPGCCLIKDQSGRFREWVEKIGLQGKNAEVPGKRFYDTLDRIAEEMEQLGNGFDVLPGGPIHYQGVSYRLIHPMQADARKRLAEYQRQEAEKGA